MIKTKIGTIIVHTVAFRDEWITIVSGFDKMKSIEANNLQDAGCNHLSRCYQLKQLLNKKEANVSLSI